MCVCPVSQIHPAAWCAESQILRAHHRYSVCVVSQVDPAAWCAESQILRAHHRYSVCVCVLSLRSTLLPDALRARYCELIIGTVCVCVVSQVDPAAWCAESHILRAHHRYSVCVCVLSLRSTLLPDTLRARYCELIIGTVCVCVCPVSQVDPAAWCAESHVLPAHHRYSVCVCVFLSLRSTLLPDTLRARYCKLIIGTVPVCVWQWVCVSKLGVKSTTAFESHFCVCTVRPAVNSLNPLCEKKWYLVVKVSAPPPPQNTFLEWNVRKQKKWQVGLCTNPKNLRVVNRECMSGMRTQSPITQSLEANTAYVFVACCLLRQTSIFNWTPFRFVHRCGDQLLRAGSHQPLLHLRRRVVSRAQRRRRIRKFLPDALWRHRLFCDVTRDYLKSWWHAHYCPTSQNDADTKDAGILSQQRGTFPLNLQLDQELK